MKEIPLSIPNLDLNIIDNLRSCIESGWISTGGKFINKFEEKLAKYLNVKEVVGIQSGTEALHLVYKYFNFTDCEVIVPTVTFIGSINPLLYVNSYPIFMDCDDTLNMDLDKVEGFCLNECDFIDSRLINKKTKRHIKGIVVVHVFGNPIDMERVMSISQKYKLVVVEDACESIGSYYTSGKYKGMYTGTIGHAGVFSFNANKIITTGGGGAIASRDDDLLKKVRFWSVQSKNDPVYFIHDEIGYNYRMLNINAALGVSQIDYLDEFIKTKITNYKLYKENLKNIDGLRLLPFNSISRANHWFYSIIVDSSKYGITRDNLMNRLNDLNIQTRPLWGLMHEQLHLSNYQNYQITKAKYYVDNLINIPCSTNLSKADILSVVKELNYKYEDNNDLVSIITPIYNSEKYIRETIESVLSQTYQNYEMICVDDCSIDNSSKIIKEYQKKDKRIKYYKLDINSGAAVARNYGLDKANGRFIAFLDSDDLWESNKLEIQIEIMKRNNIGFSFTAYQMIDKNGNLYEKIIKAPEEINYQKLLKNTIIGCLTVVIDKRIIGDFKMIDIRDSQDYATWLNILKNGNSAYGINICLAKYRKVNGSISSNKLKALKSNWIVYRDIEKLSLIKTLYVFTFYVVNALKKHLLLR